MVGKAAGKQVRSFPLIDFPESEINNEWNACFKFEALNIFGYLIKILKYKIRINYYLLRKKSIDEFTIHVYLRLSLNLIIMYLETVVEVFVSI